MEKKDKLKEIWASIPNVGSYQLDLSKEDIIKRFMEVFHIGEYFYVIFNTITQEMEFVSPNIERVLGYSKEDFSLQLLLDHVHPLDLPYYYHYEHSAVRFFTSLNPELFFSYKFSYDFRVRTGEGEYKRVLQQIVPVSYFPEGGARTLGVFTDLTHLGLSGIPKLSFIGMNGAPSYYNVHLKEEFKISEELFTRSEKQILNFLIQGLSTKEIAERQFRSVHTITTHRKNILEKSGCRNSQELLVRSIREGWV